MPFLDHLEELRWHILWSLAALVVGSAIGFFGVQHFDVLALLKAPIAPFLPDGKLFVTRPTEAFFITLKLALLVGVVLAAPIIVWRIWSFLSPALYEHEKRHVVPALLAGIGLFIAGSLMAYLWVLPAALKIFFSFQRADLEFIITANEYFSFATQIILAFGIMFELPVFMVFLAGIGLVGPSAFAKNRPFALVIAAILAAMLTPPDVVSMLMLMAPIVLLYEVGIMVSRVVWKRRINNTIAGAMLIMCLLGGASSLSAQGGQPPPPPPEGQAKAPQDTLPQPVDTAAARKLGLPTQPSRSFPPADSIMQALAGLSGYGITRYAADSLALLARTSAIALNGDALVEREGSTLEADSVLFLQAECRMLAGGEPKVFDSETVLVGGGMTYDTCLRRGIVSKGLTRFNQQGVDWYLRGELAVDSASTRMYAAHSNVTSCDLPTPHYHFEAHNTKWVSNNLLVARPAILYVRDVPILWLPFMFQDMRLGRRSGILVPRFGINDLVRPSSGYQRHVTNTGYYFAINDYMDLQASVDWFSGNFVALNGQFRYRWLNQFMSGNLALSRIFESGVDGGPGARSMRLQWTHQQSFDQRTSLNANVDFATSSRVVQRNSVDPLVQTATLGSRINFNKRYDWGTVTAGGSRTQDLSNNTVSQTLPNLSISPVPINLSESVTWSPSFALTRTQRLSQRPGIPLLSAPSGQTETVDSLFPDQRSLSVRFNTPLRIGPWNLQNDFTFNDFRSNRPPPPITIVDPNDSTQITTRFFGEDFNSSLDWNTGINLPILFPSTWKLQPSVGIQNKTAGPFMIRNRFSDGRFVSQGKRLSFSASLSPTFFGFLPGVAGLARIRHAISPRINWNLRPSATVPEAYAQAVAGPGGNFQRKSPTTHTISIGLSQTFEGKLKRSPDDTTSDPRSAPKIKVLRIQTSSIRYDFEQAKKPGRNGWQTQSLQNTFTSDLLRGFTLSTSHDLWDGPVGFDSTSFDPFLTSVSARFSLTGATLTNVLALFTGGETKAEPEEDLDEEDDLLQPQGTATGPPRGLDPAIDRLGARRLPGRGFRASITYDDKRRRPRKTSDSTVINTPAQRTVGLQVGFSPTPSWSVSWNTQYNATTKNFGQHIVRLDREMHRWRATFSFIKAPNGNFAFNFFITLTDQPELKFQYDQRTVRQGGR